MGIKPNKVMVLNQLFNYCSAIFLLLAFSLSTARSQTIDFNTVTNDTGYGLSYSVGGFTFSINDPGNGRQIVGKTGLGYLGSATLYDNNPDPNKITQWTIIQNSGAEFQFKNIYLQDAGFGSTTGTIQGFKNGAPVGTAKAINFNGYKDYASDPDFFDVDEIRINAADINFTSINLCMDLFILHWTQILLKSLQLF